MAGQTQKANGEPPLCLYDGLGRTRDVTDALPPEGSETYELVSVRGTTARITL